MTTLSKLQNVIKKTSPHGKVAQKITGEPCFFTCPTSLDSFKGYFVIIITVFKTDVKGEKKKPKLKKLS